MKIIIINHSFQVKYYYRRWELFAEKHPDVEVVCLAPQKHEWYKGGYTFGKEQVLIGREITHDNFRIRLFRQKTYPLLGWTSPDFKKILCGIQPDVVYHIGGHRQLSLYHIIKICKKHLPQTKVIGFSMRGPHHNIKLEHSSCGIYRWLRRRFDYIYEKGKLNYINKNCDAFFCHYPDAVQAFRDEGYTGAVYMQTQVGVNEEWFHEDLDARKIIRKKYDIAESTYVFGSASRFSVDKGVDVILNALPKDKDWCYLMMGSGTKEEEVRLQRCIKKLGLCGKVIMTGFIDWFEMAKYWNAVDCAIHVPLTGPSWVETFSLSAVQPQITKKPVIGSDSGSMPYQIGFKEMIVPEGDVKALREKILWVLSHRRQASEFGDRMYIRAHNGFEVQHLNDMFYDTLVEDIIPGKFDERKQDMVTYKPKENSK